VAHSAGADAGRTGRPGTFQKGHDPRRNLGGRKPSRATQALHEAITDGDLVTMWKAGIREAKAGNEKWAALIAAYFDGKPVARQEDGKPGDFGLDLNEWSVDDLERVAKKLRRVK
jgi:hypothetical protein